MGCRGMVHAQAKGRCATSGVAPGPLSCLDFLLCLESLPCSDSDSRSGSRRPADRGAERDRGSDGHGVGQPRYRTAAASTSCGVGQLQRAGNGIRMSCTSCGAASVGPHPPGRSDPGCRLSPEASPEPSTGHAGIVGRRPDSDAEFPVSGRVARAVPDRGSARSCLRVAASRGVRSRRVPCSPSPARRRRTGRSPPASGRA